MPATPALLASARVHICICAGEAGYEEYAKRAKTHELKNIDQRVRTGDLSQGLGTAEQYAAMRNT